MIKIIKLATTENIAKNLEWNETELANANTISSADIKQSTTDTVLGTRMDSRIENISKALLGFAEKLEESERSAEEQLARRDAISSIVFPSSHPNIADELAQSREISKGILFTSRELLKVAEESRNTALASSQASKHSFWLAVVACVFAAFSFVIAFFSLAAQYNLW